MPYTFPASVLLVCLPGLVAAQDWNWSSEPSRNNVAPAQNVPVDLARVKPHWEVKLGRYAYTTPTIAHDNILVGATAEQLTAERYRRRNSRELTGTGALFCLDRQDGSVRWQLPTRGIALENVNAWWFGWYGLCAAPVSAQDRVYVVGSSGDVFCLDLHGLSNGNQGMQDELAYLQQCAVSPLEALQDDDADILWRYDMAVELAIPMHDAMAGTPLLLGNQLWVPTNRGFGDSTLPGQHPSALLTADGFTLLRKAPEQPVPNMIVLDAESGRLLAWDEEPVPVVYHGQWSSPALWQQGDQRLVVYPDAAGYLHAYRVPEFSDEATQVLEAAWLVDCVPASYRHDESGQERHYEVSEQAKERGVSNNDIPAPCEIIAAPVVADGLVYVALGRDQNHGPAKGALSCFDPAQLDETGLPTLRWRTEDLGTSMCSLTIHDGICYFVDTGDTVRPARLYAFDARSGQEYWRQELDQSTRYASPLIVDGRLYQLAQRDLFVFSIGRDGGQRLAHASRIGQEAPTPVVADGHIYLGGSKLKAYAAANDSTGE